MKFLELVLQNFGPYGGKQIINFDPKPNHGDNCPIVLLGGMNGGGKTTIMDAIRLALYGHRAQCSTRGNLSYGDFLTQCVHGQTHPGEKTRLELAFEHIENDKPIRYRVVRTWERNPIIGKDHLGILDIRDADEWLDEGLVNIWDEYIENLLPLGISNLFLFDGEQVKELAELENPPTLVVDAIRALLGLELAERLAIDIDILANRKRKELADTQELANLEEIEHKLGLLQREREVQERKLAGEMEALLTAEKRQQEAFDKFVSQGGKIAGERKKLEDEYQRKLAEVENIRQGLTELAAGFSPLLLIENLLLSAQTQAEEEWKIQQAQIAREIIFARDERLLNWCRSQKISNIDKIQEFLAQDVTTLNANLLQPEEPWLKPDADAIASLGNILYYLKNSQNIAKQQLKLLHQKEDEIIQLERQLQTAASPEEYQLLTQTLKDAQNIVIQATANCQTTKERILALDAEIAAYKKDLQNYTDTAISRKNTETILATSARVQDTLRVFRERLTLRKLNKLETEVTECFRYLLHKSDLIHRIAIDTETFRLSLYDIQGQLVPKHRLSAGEKQLLAIAFLWGLARVSGRRLPVTIDTPLGRLDSSHRSNLIERYFSCASHQVILLSTDTEIDKSAVEKLRNMNAIAHEYLLKYDSQQRRTQIVPGYFW